MSEHHNTPKPHEPHAIAEEKTKGPHDPKEINPKIASDIAYWSKEFGVTGDQLHEAIRSHGTHVEKVRQPSTQKRSKGLRAAFFSRDHGCGYSHDDCLLWIA